MNESSAKRASTRVSRIIKAERKAVYHAFLDPDSVASWLAPNNMRGHVHAFDAREGGTFRMSLTYQNPEHSLAGKTSEDTGTFQGRFVELVPDANGGTEITILCEDIPKGIRPEDNELGCKESLQKLAAFLE